MGSEGSRDEGERKEELGIRPAGGRSGGEEGVDSDEGFRALPAQAPVLSAPRSPIPARWRHLLWRESSTADFIEGFENLGSEPLF